MCTTSETYLLAPQAYMQGILGGQAFYAGSVRLSHALVTFECIPVHLPEYQCDGGTDIETNLLLPYFQINSSGNRSASTCVCRGQ